MARTSTSPRPLFEHGESGGCAAIGDGSRRAFTPTSWSKPTALSQKRVPTWCWIIFPTSSSTLTRSAQSWFGPGQSRSLCAARSVTPLHASCMRTALASMQCQSCTSGGTPSMRRAPSGGPEAWLRSGMGVSTSERSYCETSRRYTCSSGSRRSSRSSFERVRPFSCSRTRCDRFRRSIEGIRDARLGPWAALAPCWALSRRAFLSSFFEL